VNLELWSKQVELEPGQSLTVRHQYEVKVVGGVQSKPLEGVAAATTPITPMEITVDTSVGLLSPGERFWSGRATAGVPTSPVHSYLARVVNPFPLSEVGGRPAPK